MNPKREFVAVGLTAWILIGLAVFSQPTQLILAGLTGPDQVTTAEFATFQTTVELRSEEQTEITEYAFVFTTPARNRVTVTATAEGDVLSVASADGTGVEAIDVDQLARSVQVECDPVGGARYGYVADDDGGLVRLSVDAGAFDPGEYDLRVRARTSDGQTAESNAHTVEVVTAQGSG